MIAAKLAFIGAGLLLVIAVSLWVPDRHLPTPRDARWCAIGFCGALALITLLRWVLL